jgi:hypothetical protein
LEVIMRRYERASTLIDQFTRRLVGVGEKNLKHLSVR